MPDTGLGAERDAAVERLTSAYARDLISMEDLEARLGAVAGADSVDAVRATVVDLPAHEVAVAQASGGPALPEAQQLIRGSMQSVRRKGRWLRSKRLVVVQSASSIRLDLSELERFPRQEFELSLALEACSCRVAVPLGTRIIDRLETHASSYRCARVLSRHETDEGCTLIVSGRMVASSLRFRRARRAPRRASD